MAFNEIQAELKKFAEEAKKLEESIGKDFEEMSEELQNAIENETLGVALNQFLTFGNEAMKLFGQYARVPQLTGLDLDKTPLLMAKALNISTSSWPTGPKNSVLEPGVPMSDHHNATVISASYGGSHIHVHGGAEQNDEFINIIHNHGRIVIDPDGVITIKSHPRVFIGSNGDVDIQSEEHITNVAQGGYTIEVTDGAINVSSKGDINFTTNGSINMNAATDIKMNCGANMDVAAKGRMAFMAAADNIDISAGRNLKIGALAGNITVQSKGANIYNEAAGAIYSTADGEITVYAGGNLGLKGSTVYVKGGGIYLNEPDQDVSKPGAGPEVVAAQIGVEPPEAAIVSDRKRDPYPAGMANADDGGDGDGGAAGMGLDPELSDIAQSDSSSAAAAINKALEEDAALQAKIVLPNSVVTGTPTAVSTDAAGNDAFKPFVGDSE